MLSEKLFMLHIRATKIRGGHPPIGRKDYCLFRDLNKPHTLCVPGDSIPEENKPNETYIKTPDVSENYKTSP